METKKINPYIFRGYDIRGIAGKDLDYDIVKRIAKAYAFFLSKRRIKNAVVGHDCRITGEEYKKAFISGLFESGINVIDLGMCLTQMVYFAQYHYKTNGGVMITASHNPKDYNGAKLCLGYSHTLGTEEIKEIKEIVDSGKTVENKKIGMVTKAENLKEAYFHDLLKRTTLVETEINDPKTAIEDLEKRESKWREKKIVVDASNGTMGDFAPELLELMGYEVIKQNCEVDGSFPNGTPDPTEVHILDRLGKRVVQEKADFGVAYDGDGDRLGVVDEKGRPIWADVLVAIFADDILDFLPGGKIVYNVLCSKMVEEVVEKKGVPIMHKTGHSFIKEKVSIEKAIFGGELSGHFFFVDNFYGHDDALFATIRLLEYLSRKEKPLFEIIDSLPSYISSPEIKVGTPDEKKVELVDKKLLQEFRELYPKAKLTTIDGVRVDFQDGMIVIRYSQNGPYITIKFEAKSEEVYKERKKTIYDILKKHEEVDWKEGANLNALIN